MYINKFIPICILPSTNFKIRKNTKIKLIHKSVKFIIINEGSHTRIISYKNKDETRIQVFQHHERKIYSNQRRIRYVWLETSLYTKMTFARSLWTIIEKDIDIKSISRNYAIGNSFINHKTDINKNIIEVQCCYCKNFEKQIKSKEIILCKKYQLNYNKKSIIIIQEFFSINTFI